MAKESPKIYVETRKLKTERKQEPHFNKAMSYVFSTRNGIIEHFTCRCCWMCVYNYLSNEYQQMQRRSVEITDSTSHVLQMCLFAVFSASKNRRLFITNTYILL
jgi:hypothetical protein